MHDPFAQWRPLSFELNGQTYAGLYKAADGCVTVRVTRPDGMYWENSTHLGGSPPATTARHLIREILDGQLTS
jgi:hypothetical protein